MIIWVRPSEHMVEQGKPSFGRAGLSAIVLYYKSYLLPSLLQNKTCIFTTTMLRNEFLNFQTDKPFNSYTQI